MGREQDRKLAPNDRLMGTLNLCTKRSVDFEPVYTSIAAALLFNDSVEGKAFKYIKTGKDETFFKEICKLRRDSAEWKMIIN